MALAKESGIYVSVGLDSDALLQDAAKLRAQMGKVGEEISKQLGGSLAPAKLRNDLVGITTDLAKVSAAAKNLDLRVKVDGLDAVAKNAGMAESKVNELYGAMVKTANEKAFENTLNRLQKQTGLTAAEMAKLRREAGDVSGALKTAFSGLDARPTTAIAADMKTVVAAFREVKSSAGEASKETQRAAVAMRESLKKLATEAKGVKVAPSSDVSGLQQALAQVQSATKLSAASLSNLTAEAARFSAQRDMDSAFARIKSEAGLSTVQLAKLRMELGDTSGAMSTLWAGAKSVAVPVMAVGAAALYAGKACFDAGLQLDRLDKSYTSIAGSSQSAAAQLDYVYNVTDKLGLQFQTSAESAKNFFAAGAGTTLEKDLNGIFEGVSTAASALSLTQDQVSRTFVALGQMISKGKVSSEELRQQLGEHIPGALGLASKAMGVSTAQLNKMMERGELLAEDLLPKLAQALKDKYAAGAIEAADGAQAAVNRMSTEWERFKASASNTELAVAGINAVTGALKYMSQEMDKNEIDRKMREAGVSPEGVFTSGNGLRQEMIYTDAQREAYKQRQSAEQQALAATKDRQEASDRAAEKEAENLRIITESVNKYTGALKETKLAKAETDYAAIANPIKEMLAAGKGDADELRKQLALVDKAYADTLKKINDKGRAGSGSTAIQTATIGLERLREEVANLEAANIPAVKGFEQVAAKLALERDQAVAAAEAHAKLAIARKVGVSQANEQKTLEIRKAELTYLQKIAEAETKNAEVRLDFEKRYADMVGATSQGIIDSIRKQVAEYEQAGADRVRLAEWERDQIQRASTDAWDGAQVALRDYSAEAGNQAKGMNETFDDLFNGIDSAGRGMWGDLLENGKISLSSFKSLFANFLADLMHMAITRPITVSIAGAVSGMVGGGTGTAQAGQMMGGGGGMNVGGLTSFIPKDFMGNITGGITDTINSTMMDWFPSTFGTGIATNFAGSAGSLTSGTLSTAAINSIGSSGYGGMAFAPGANLPTFTGAVGPALAWGGAGGAVGGMASPYFNDMLGITNGKNAQIGSTVGGVGSTAVMTGLAAANIWNPGGWVMAGIAALSALFGGSMGGLFDKKPKRPAVWGGTEIDLGNDSLYAPGSYDFGATFDPKNYGRDSFEMYEDGNYAIATRSRNKAGSDVAKAMSLIMREVAELGVQQADAVQESLPDAYAAAFKEQLSANPVSAEWDFKGDDINEENFKKAAEELQQKINDSMFAAFKGMDFSEYAGKIDVDQSAIEGLARFTQAIKLTEEAIEATARINDPVSELEQQAETAKTQLAEWTKAMEAAGVTTEYASQLVGDYSNTMIGKFISDMEDSLNPLSQYAQAQKDANKAVDDRLAALKILGASEEQLAQVEGLRAGVLQAMTAAMVTGFEQDMRVRQAQLTGDEALIASTQLTVQHERELSQIREKFGADSVQFAQTQYMQIAETAQLAWQQQQTAAEKALKAQEAAAQKALQDQATAAQGALTAANKAESEANAALSKAQSDLNSVRNAYLSALNKEASTLKSTMDAVNKAVEQLSRTRRDLLTNAETSTLDTAERYALTGAELERVYASAMGGDAEAMAELATLSSKYLDVSKEANADFSKYRKDFEKVQAMLAAVETSGMVQIDTAQKELDLLNAQIAAATEGTGQIVGSIKELEAAFLKALGDYNAAQEAARVAQQAAEEARRKAEEAAQNAQNNSQNNSPNGSQNDTQPAPKTWMQDVLDRKAAAMNRGETLAPGQTAGGWTADSVLKVIESQLGGFAAWYAQYGKFEGFAKGGLASGWALVGEEGPELVNFSQPGRVYTADETAEMFSPSSSFSADTLQASTVVMPMPLPSSNSNAVLVQELQALRREVAQLRTEQARITDATQRTARSLSRWDIDGLPGTRNLQ